MTALHNGLENDRKDDALPALALKDKIALVVGVANEHSIATGCAQAFRLAGADVALTYALKRRSPL